MSPEQHEHTGEPRPRRRRWWLLALPIVAAVAGVAWLAVWLLTPSTFTVSGYVEIGDCTSQEFSDVVTGLQIQVLNQQNEVLGVAPLQQDTTRCRWTFAVDQVPAGERMYGVKVGPGARGVVWRNEEKARQEFGVVIPK